MVALARRGMAVLAVLIAILAPAILFYLPFETAAPWRESIFGTVSSTLGRFVQAEPKTQIRLVAIDEATIGGTEPWPWSNEQLTTLVTRLQAGAPRLVIVDIAPHEAAASTQSAGDVVLDRRLSGDPALVQSAWRLPKVPTANLLPLLSTDGRLITPAPVVADAMSIARLSALRIDGRLANSNWSLVGPGIHRLAPIPVALKAWDTAADGSLRLLPDGAPTGLGVISAGRLLGAGAATPRDFKGAVVIVRHAASAAPNTSEWREAQALAQLLNGLTPARPYWALLAEAIAAALAAGLVSLLMVLNRVHTAALAASVAIIVFFAAAGAMFIFRLELIDPVTSSAFVIGALVFSGLTLIARRSLGANAASPAKTRTNGTPLIGIERREVTVLVCAIRDLGVLTEIYRDSPIAMTRLVGKVLGTAAEIIRAHRGTVENIGPAGLTAIFNAPGTDAHHAEKAAEAALAVLGRLDPLNEALEKTLAHTGIAFTPVQFSIGIDTGDAVVGDIGFKARREFAAFGPALDGAQILAGFSTTYGPAILVGDKTEALINRSFALLELDLREAPNSNTRSFFALLGNPVLRANPRFKTLQDGFRAFHAAYRKGSWDQASQLLGQCSKLPGVSPKLIGLYEQRITYLKASPQRRDWSGILRRPIE